MNDGLWQTPTQTELLISKLCESRALGNALELPDIMRLGIAHGARYSELRRRGFTGENELDANSTGIVRSRYSLRHDPERDGERQ